jgi:biotin transport system substrate-specific component
MSQAQTSKIFSLINYPIVISETVLRSVGVLVFIVLTGLGAFVRIPLPFTPVPITLQTFFVLLAGAMLGKKFGFFSQAGYVTLGAIGVPIFAGATSGIGCLLGPSGGYLFGFMVASFLIGILLEKNKNFTQIITAFLVATVVIYVFGIMWLMAVLRVGLGKAIFVGIVPFIGGDLIKLILAALIYDKLKFKFYSVRD